CGLIPGTDQPISGHHFAGTGIASTKDRPVIIPDSPSGSATTFPNAAAEYQISDLTIGATASSAAKLTLSGTTTDNIAVSGTLTNKGTIVYSGAARIKKGGAFHNDATQGTVEFTSDSGATDLASVDYYNLTISGTGAFESNGDLTVNNDLKVLAGTAKFNNSAGDDTTTAATAAFSTGTKISLGNNKDDNFTVGGALNLPSDLADLSLAGTITAGGTGISLGHDAALNDDTTFVSPTKTTGAVTLTGAHDVTTNDLDTNAGVLTLENANLINTGTVTDGKIIFIGTGAQTFTPCASPYASVEVNKTSGGVTVDQALTATDFTVTKNGTLTTSDGATLTTANLTITNNTTATFNELVTVSTEYRDAATAGDITFAKGCAFTPATTFNTTGTVTLNGSATACNFAGGLEHITGSTSISGNITASDSAITFAATTLADNTTINAGSGAVTINGTLNGAKAFTSNGTGTVTFAGAVGATAAPTTITVTGPTIISAPSVKTSGLQNYKDNLTFDATTCAVTGKVKADAELIVNTSKAATLNGATTVAGDITNNGTLSATANLTFASNFNGGSGTFSSTATVTA
ncbi:MAG: hypothetical protein J5700_00170, partial [Treponema sp.]|nr:hypothetical protein [Treponema sp.]